MNKDDVYSVRTYAGYKGEETPRSLLSAGGEWTIDRILSRRRVIDTRSGKEWEEFVARVGTDIVKIKIFPSGEKDISFLS